MEVYQSKDTIFSLFIRYYKFYLFNNLFNYHMAAQNKQALLVGEGGGVRLYINKATFGFKNS